MFHHRQGLPDDWYDIVTDAVAIWQYLDADERELLEANSDWLLRHKHWEAANGFALNEEIMVTIAMLAAVPLLGLDVDAYREVSAIIVYPNSMVSRGTYAGPASGTVRDAGIPILGEAHDRRGPIILAWDSTRDSARHLGSGHNVVYHEFAHKLDMLDAVVDGTPPLPNRSAVERWVEVCTAPFEALRAGDDRPPLQPYGATNPAEFFAVATEAFFDVPVELARNEPDLYSVLAAYFHQDPAARVQRSGFTAE
jgi:Mlc titration factor MtfA (ptsG expression regulator)